MSTTIEIDYFNSYLVKKIKTSLKTDVSAFPGVSYPGVLAVTGNNANDYSNRNYFVEESRIRGGFNNVSTDLGVRAYLDEQYPLQQHRINTLIYSGIYNSRTGLNNTNVFSIGDSITKSVDPVYGSIQKTFAEETNLIVFQENRIYRALIDKDTIYTTESGTQTQAGAAVIGQFVQYKGEYGISKNPESFAIYNYRKYFSDKNRNAIIRLSNDGLTEISSYGMQDYFRDELALVDNSFQTQELKGTVASGGTTTTTKVLITTSTITSGQNITAGMSIAGQPGYIKNVTISGSNTAVYYSQLFSSNLSGEITFNYSTRGRVIGGWDIHNKNYVVSLQKNTNQVSTASNTFETLSFDEGINGWVSFFTFKPNQLFSVLNNVYSTQNASLYEHYDNTTANNRGSFYGVQSPANVTFVFNPNGSIMKNFKTVAYEGSNGWEVTSFVSGFTGFDPDPANPGSYIQNQDTTGFVRSYQEGAYDGAGNEGTAASASNPPLLRSGFDRKENRYVANLISTSVPRAAEVIYQDGKVTGIKGYFATVTIETDQTTQLGGAKELWSASSEFVISSY
jgi:hypothetical protein